MEKLVFTIDCSVNPLIGGKINDFQ
jgi:hypothetical protein